MASIFTRIVRGEIPCYKIAESERFLAFLDINPFQKGHTLVIPKEEIDYYFDLPDELLADLMVFAKSVAIAVKKAIPCERVGVMVVGDEVPHAHVHLIPFQKASDMSIGRKTLQLSPEEMSEIARRIREFC
jgi:histidine triad (HIT) family protein